jgi:protocatechuate 3,4-dioxygenase beta subunit
MITRAAAALVLCLVVPSSASPAPGLPPAALQVAPPGEPGTRLTVAGVLQDRQGRPIAGADLHVYQTDASGRYTVHRAMDEPRARLAGHVRSGPRGEFTLRTIRPGEYRQTVRLQGRERHIPAHIHIDVTAPGHAERRFQVVFADDPLLSDPYWQDWVKRLRQPVVEVKPGEQGLTATLVLVVD